MNRLLTWIALLSAVFLTATGPRGAAQAAAGGVDSEVLNIDKFGGGRLVPVAIEGFAGEALEVIRFDLEVQGFKVVSAAEASFLISGSAGGSLVGRVTDAVSKASVLAKEYNGGTTRSQAHKFTDDFIGVFPGRSGIASRKIAFRMETSKGSEIYVADYDGFGAVEVTRDGTISRDPAWVPGARMLLYTSYKNGGPAIYSHDLATGVRRTVANFPGLNAAPAISPDGRRVAMILSRMGSPDLYVANLDGSEPRRLTTTKEDESSPCWSPDGRTLCVVSRMSGRPALYSVPAGGGAMRRIATTGASNTTEPSWSPDGKTIVFTTSSGGFRICTVPAGGGAVDLLTKEQSRTGIAGEDPVWAPNSRTVMFTRRVGGKRVLSLLDVPTKQVKDMRHLSGSCSQPDWSK